jgi:SAM-dependent methyltransferase
MTNQNDNDHLNLYRNNATLTDPDDNNYKGLQIFALRGLHAEVLRLLNQFTPKNSSILELASGTGALAKRLSDAGYKVTASDAVPENFRLKEQIEFRLTDLNKDFSNGIDDNFDGIIAVEILEHLENPRHVFRQAFKALRSGGIFLITTPNIDNPVSKAMFARFGYSMWFNDEHYEREGHITPLSLWQIRKCAHEAGFDIIFTSSFGNPYRHVRGWPKMKILAWILGAISNPSATEMGEILIMAMRKS